jgi:DNA-binding transcriptional LysR family regulator
VFSRRHRDPQHDAAAEALSMSQPAVSRLMRDMKINLGLTLFRRRKGWPQPTEEALALYAEVERARSSVSARSNVRRSCSSFHP